MLFIKKLQLAASKTLLATIASLFLSQITAANGLEGTDDPKLQTAIKQWLSDNDEQSLPALSALAKDGNIAARLLLGRIEETDIGSASSSYVRSLNRQQRHELFRSGEDDQSFYPSWLAYEAGRGNTLAQNLFKARFTVVDLPLIEKLVKLGEPEASNDLLRTAGFYGSQVQLNQLLDNDSTPAEWRPLLYGYIQPIEMQAEGKYALRLIAGNTKAPTPETLKSSDKDTLDAAVYMMLGLPFATISPESRWYDAVGEWFMTSDNMRPIANLCKRSCPQEPIQCAIGVMGLHGGYFESIRIDSPLENLIPQQQFLESPRAQGMALRRATLRRANTYRQELISTEELANSSQCLADLVKKARLEN